MIRYDRPHRVFARPVHSIAFLFLLLPFISISQHRMEGREFPGRSAPITFETLRFFGPDTNKGIVDVLYRIPRSFFVFVRTDQPDSQGSFVARGHLLVELSDNQDVSVARRILPIELKRASLPGREEQQGDLEGALTFTLPRDTYKIVFEVDDLESGSSFVDKMHTVQAFAASEKSLDLSSPFFASIDSSHGRGVEYVPFNQGANIVFGSTYGGTLCEVHSSLSDTALKVDWKLHGQEENRSEKIVDLKETRFELRDGRLNITTSEGPVRFECQASDSSWKILYVPIPIQTLEPGKYKLELNVSNGKDQSKQELSFRVIWPNRPMSLTDWDIATDALKYIANPEEMDKIHSSSDEGWKAFVAFWRAKDPDTTTAYNEMMVEYYRRVDEAIRQFSTVKEQDGYKTDRGRIYILNGQPSHTERSVLPGQPTREIWTYDTMRKQFVFTEKNKSGNYILTQTANF